MQKVLPFFTKANLSREGQLLPSLQSVALYLLKREGYACSLGVIVPYLDAEL